MMKKTTLILCLTALFLGLGYQEPLLARPRFTPRTRLVNERHRPAAERHYNLGLAALKEERFAIAARHFKMLTRDFHPSLFPTEAYYLLGLSLYQLDELDGANYAWNTYLEKESEPTHLEDIMQAKIDIAERCRKGASARLFGIRSLPKWSNGYDVSLAIYDEIIATLPTSDLAATALLGRARLFCKQGGYAQAIDSLYLLVRRFPNHELTPEGYLAMQEVYLAQARSDGQNPDTLSLAEVSLNRFTANYPKDHRLEAANTLFEQIRDTQARSLLTTACFYYRTKQPSAAILYAKATLRQFPDTPTADYARGLLFRLGCPVSTLEENLEACKEEAAEEEDCSLTEDPLKEASLEDEDTASCQAFQL